MKKRFRRPRGKVAMAIAGTAIFAVGLGGGALIGHATAGDDQGGSGATGTGSLGGSDSQPQA